MGSFEAKARVDWLSAAPLFLLIAAAFSPFIHVSGRPYAGTRYLGIPMAGFSIGASFFLLLSRGRAKCAFSAIGSVSEKGAIMGAASASAAYLAFFLALMYFRWDSLGYGFFDFGSYDQKLWLISLAGWRQKLSLSVDGHASPVLAVYSLPYSLGLSPFILQALQAAAVTGGAIPVYLLSKRLIRVPAFRLFAVLLYLVLPATQFNASGDFHPDHLYIPVMLWALYLIESERVLASLPFLALSLAIKEPLMPGTALLGVYMAWAKKRYSAGGALFAVSLAAFIITKASGETTFSGVAGSLALDDPSFAHLSTGGLKGLVLHALEPEKLRFPYFLLMPLLCLPLLSFKEFMPAMAPIGIALLSSSVNHQGVGSHYTAGALPFLFFAFVHTIGKLEKRFSGAQLSGLFAWVFALTAAFSVAHSPTPLSISFWEASWSQGDWHISNYRSSARTPALKEALSLLPEDPSARVVAHSKVYSPVLSHRLSYRPFPDGWKEADYIVLDLTRGGYTYDRPDEEGFMAALREVNASGLFEVAYASQGVTVMRRKPSR